jgi:hypothetical protein
LGVQPLGWFFSKQAEAWTPNELRTEKSKLKLELQTAPKAVGLEFNLEVVVGSSTGWFFSKQAEAWTPNELRTEKSKLKLELQTAPKAVGLEFNL